MFNFTLGSFMIMIICFGGYYITDLVAGFTFLTLLFALGAVITWFVTLVSAVLALAESLLDLAL